MRNKESQSDLKPKQIFDRYAYVLKESKGSDIQNLCALLSLDKKTIEDEQNTSIDNVYTIIETNINSMNDTKMQLKKELEKPQNEQDNDVINQLKKDIKEYEEFYNMYSPLADRLPLDQYVTEKTLNCGETAKIVFRALTQKTTKNDLNELYESGSGISDLSEARNLIKMVSNYTGNDKENTNELKTKIKDEIRKQKGAYVVSLVFCGHAFLILCDKSGEDCRILQGNVARGIKQFSLRTWMCDPKSEKPINIDKFIDNVFELQNKNVHEQINFFEEHFLLTDQQYTDKGQYIETFDTNNCSQNVRLHSVQIEPINPKQELMDILQQHPKFSNTTGYVSDLVVLDPKKDFNLK